jgi:hypothetical protein
MLCSFSWAHSSLFPDNSPKFHKSALQVPFEVWHFRLESVSSYAMVNDALMFKTFYQFSLIEKKKRGVFVEEGGGGRNILLLYTPMPFSV